jgi:DivIVA domain-containing protein
MLLAVVACVLGLAVVLLALYRDEPLAAPIPEQPAWDALPAPADIGRWEFRLSYPGYDPAAVETYLDALRRAYTDLYTLVPEEVLAEARGEDRA